MSNLISSESLELLRSNKTYYMSTKQPLMGFNSSIKILKGLKKYATLFFIKEVENAKGETEKVRRFFSVFSVEEAKELLNS